MLVAHYIQIKTDGFMELTKMFQHHQTDREFEIHVLTISSAANDEGRGCKQ